MKNSVELCQRFGRARQQNSSIVVLDERRDRPLEMLESTRLQQDAMVASYNPSRDGTSKDDDLENAKQEARERTAYHQVFGKHGVSAAMRESLKNLNRFVAKTKGALGEKWTSTRNDGNNNKLSQHSVCEMTYTSSKRSIESKATGPNKKKAKQECAKKLLALVEEQTRPVKK